MFWAGNRRIFLISTSFSSFVFKVRAAIQNFLEPSICITVEGNEPNFEFLFYYWIITQVTRFPDLFCAKILSIFGLSYTLCHFSSFFGHHFNCIFKSTLIYFEQFFFDFALIQPKNTKNWHRISKSWSWNLLKIWKKLSLKTSIHFYTL